MENRFQHLLLKLSYALVVSLILTPYALADEERDTSAADRDTDINSEVFELGLVVGLVNIADFNGETAVGISATFRASEDFFLQYNFIQADASPSSFEKSQGLLFEGGDRTFRHYDLLVGYNLFQGEFFPSGSQARLSALYLVGGVGETQFGGEESFSYTAGVGYQIALTRRIIARFDYRSYIYTSNLVADEDQTVNSAQLSAGLSFLF